MKWTDAEVLVTGGASFIGSHLVDALVGLGAAVRVADDLSSGNLGNIEGHLRSGAVEFLEADLRELTSARRAAWGRRVVFHLAAAHGGRGYVDTHQAEPATNLLLDGSVFRACHLEGVERIVFASSGCVYPNYLQADVEEELYLKESMVGPPCDADNLYGWAKLVGEMALKAYCDEFGMKGASCRYFTVYGPRGKEDHAVMALIAKAFVGMRPFEVWGDGSQVRNWTYVDDIVRGTILAAERVDDGTAINLGTTERTTVSEAAREILRLAGHDAEITFLPSMPVGPPNRVADNSLARELLGWEPAVSFAEGLERTVEWYFSNRTRAEASRAIKSPLER